MQATDRFPLPTRLRACVVLAFLLLSGTVCLAQNAAPPGKLLIADVVPEGNHQVPTQKIMSMIKTRPGAEYNPETIDEDVRRLMETRQFANVRAVRSDDDGKVVIHFVINEYPRTIKEIKYNGNKHLKEDELNTLTGLRVGGILNPRANVQACRLIAARYNQDGRPFATVDLQKGGNPEDDAVNFNITEGPEVQISSIEFVGNHFVSGPVLATHINSSSMFLGLFGAKYNSTIVEGDLSRLVEYYRSFGFHDVHVSRELKWTPDNRHVILVFHIEEGVRYQLTDRPQIAGLPSNVNPDEYVRLVSAKQGEAYNGQEIQKGAKKIEDYFGEEGKKANVTPQLIWGQQEGTVNVVYQVEPHPVSYVGEVRIVGNTKTRDNRILAQVPLYPGQILSYPELRRAEANLARLNIFENNPETGVRPTVSVIDELSDSPFKTVLVQVEETRTGSLLFGVGVNSDAGLTGSIVLNERNFDITRFPTSWADIWEGTAFRGNAQEFRAEAVPGTQVQRYSVSFRDNNVFDSPYSFGWSGYYFTRNYNEYTQDTIGTRFSLGRKLNDKWSAALSVRVENVGIHDVPVWEPSDFQNVVGNNLVVGPRLSLTRDTRDSYMRPTTGNRLDLSYEQVFGDFQYPILNADFNQYWTVWERADNSGKHVLALHSQATWAGSDTPVYERFYAGGFTSMRGFQFRGISPQQAGFPVGGDFMMLNSLEYQVPLKANDQIYAVAFVDTGTVEPSVEIRDYRVSAGFGIRFIVPMLGPVPIALDFGFPIVKGPGDKEQVFSFWLGFFRQ
jgi:outer membrane protein assembly complex protein YaeT